MWSSNTNLIIRLNLQTYRTGAQNLYKVNQNNKNPKHPKNSKPETMTELRETLLCAVFMLTPCLCRTSPGVSVCTAVEKIYYVIAIVTGYLYPIMLSLLLTYGCNKLQS